MRLDVYLVNENFFTSRSKAQEEIKAGHIKVNGKIIMKPNFDVDSPQIEIIDMCPYVSRGGYKLEAAIKNFHLCFDNKVVLDIGSSTGGFTDCSLQHNAKVVYSVDVGSFQLAEKLRNDSRVKLYENTNILDFTPPEKIDILVMDVSFVSVEHLIPALLHLIDDNNYLVLLIKPQFEVGKMVGKGVIRDKKVHLKVLEQVDSYLSSNGLFINKLAPSPIKGGSGNIEFIAVVSKSKKGYHDFKAIVDIAHQKE